MTEMNDEIEKTIQKRLEYQIIYIALFMTPGEMLGFSLEHGAALPDDEQPFARMGMVAAVETASAGDTADAILLLLERIRELEDRG